jgi:hypothetical protein
MLDGIQIKKCPREYRTSLRISCSLTPHDSTHSDEQIIVHQISTESAVVGSTIHLMRRIIVKCLITSVNLLTSVEFKSLPFSYLRSKGAP